MGFERAWKVGVLAEASGLTVRTLHHWDQRGTSREPSVSTLIEVLRAMDGPGPHANSEAVRGHLDSEQQRALQDHAAAVGPAAHYLLEVEWPELCRRAEALRVAGVDPGALAVQKLVKRMDELSALFSGGDSQLSSAVRGAWKREVEAADSAAETVVGGGNGRRGPGGGGCAIRGSGRDSAYSAGAWRELITYLDRARAET
ncbi:hypothetical protein [Frankia sp. AgB32]|uniref:hypothetical protein n=1 Tax=Frankia sp. AgB32 TaxID=631119 RepID=UPI00200C3E9F|nr:hypothetical protein [Frankia sp. AgB32]MCK9893255.1 hypothetical protein [Frankia sp. AgB32]